MFQPGSVASRALAFFVFLPHMLRCDVSFSIRHLICLLIRNIGGCICNEFSKLDCGVRTISVFSWYVAPPPGMRALPPGTFDASFSLIGV
ncbi:hypothetical protein F4804DRAFT_35346 [Jackrogersella minutella]|nr:hypothetical protein F4804DRAFT_35346 [Jackrogersella minutella]